MEGRGERPERQRYTRHRGRMTGQTGEAQKGAGESASCSQCYLLRGKEGALSPPVDDSKVSFAAKDPGNSFLERACTCVAFLHSQAPSLLIYLSFPSSILGPQSSTSHSFDWDPASMTMTFVVNLLPREGGRMFPGFPAIPERLSGDSDVAAWGLEFPKLIHLLAREQPSIG